MGLNIFKNLIKINPQKVFDTVASGVDEAFYTKEEQSDDARKVYQDYFEWYKTTLEESTVRSITRRILAILFAACYLLLIIASAVAYKFDPEYSSFLWEVSKTIGPYVGGIMLFYFGYYGVKNVVKENNKKKR